MSKMHKKILSFLLACLMIFSAFGFAGCSQGNEDYPVTVGNVKFEKEPSNIVVLSDNLSDIISNMGYDVRMVGKSDSVTLKELEIVPSVGNECTPDSAKIIDAKTDVVFYDNDLEPNVINALKNKGIKVIKLIYPQTKEEIITVYRSLGKILGGAKTGKAKGEEAYNSLLDNFASIKSQYSSGQILNTVCYLYMEDGQIKVAGKDSYIDLLLSYTGAVNVAVNTDTNESDLANLKISNPTYIFYSDKAVLDQLKNDPNLKKLSALKENKVMQIPYDEISLQGVSAPLTLDKMMKFMYEGVAPQVENSATNADTQANTQANAPADTTSTLAEEYEITISDNGLKPDDENDNVKAMQQRLMDLGYVSNKDNVNGYFGPTTQKAVKAFQKNNDLEETGKADKTTLETMFTEEAVKAESPVDKED